MAPALKLGLAEAVRAAVVVQPLELEEEEVVVVVVEESSRREEEGCDRVRKEEGRKRGWVCWPRGEALCRSPGTGGQRGSKSRETTAKWQGGGDGEC